MKSIRGNKTIDIVFERETQNADQSVGSPIYRSVEPPQFAESNLHLVILT